MKMIMENMIQTTKIDKFIKGFIEGIKYIQTKII
jgi:hypothetical protein